MRNFTLDNTLPRLILIALLAVGAPFLGGCENEGPAEEAGEEIDDAIGEAADEAEDAMDEVEEEL